MGIREAVQPFDHASVSSIGTTAVQLKSTLPGWPVRKGVQIKADAGNSGTVYIGLSDVTKGDVAATDGFPLAAGEGLFVPCNDITLIYAIGSASGQKVYYLVI